jgi:hypothetical protein
MHRAYDLALRFGIDVAVSRKKSPSSLTLGALLWGEFVASPKASGLGGRGVGGVVTPIARAKPAA